MGINISNFYLGTPMDIYEYMKMPFALFPDHIVKQYNLGEKAKHGFVYLELRKVIYAPPSRLPSQQAPQGTAGATWLLRSPTYPRVMETRYQASPVLPGSR